LYWLLPGSGPNTALLTFRVISWVVGGAFSLAAAVTSAYLYHAWYDRLLFCLGALTGGYALLFFGYVENYPLFVLCVGLFSLAGLLVLKEKLNRYWPLVPLVLGGLLHPYSVVMVPACLYLLLRPARPDESRGWIRRAVWVGIGVICLMLLGGAGYYLFSESYFLQLALVPPVENQFTVEGYTLLSLKHLLDWFSLLFVLAPALPLFVVVFIYRPIRKWLKRPDILFLILMIVPSLAITFLFDPKLGMPRDWDVFAFTGVPLTLIFYGATLGRDGPPSGRRIAILGIALSLLILAPRVAIQAQPDKGFALFDNYAALDKLKSRSGRFILREYLSRHGREAEAERRRLADNRLLPQEGWDIEGREYFGRGVTDSAMTKFRQAIQFDPSFYLSWANLGVAYTSIGRNDSALACLKIADGLMPYNPDNYNNLGGVYYSLGEYIQAEGIWKDAIELSSENFVAVQYLTRLYRTQNRTREYDSLLTMAVGNDRTPLNLLVDAADRMIERSEYDDAARVYRRCLVMGLDTAIVCARQDSIPQLEVIDCED